MAESRENSFHCDELKKHTPKYFAASGALCTIMMIFFAEQTQGVCAILCMLFSFSLKTAECPDIDFLRRNTRSV